MTCEHKRELGDHVLSLRTNLDSTMTTTMNKGIPNLPEELMLEVASGLDRFSLLSLSQVGRVYDPVFSSLLLTNYTHRPVANSCTFQFLQVYIDVATTFPLFCPSSLRSARSLASSSEKRLYDCATYKTSPWVSIQLRLRLRTLVQLHLSRGMHHLWN
jgi:hypothetical protein